MTFTEDVINDIMIDCNDEWQIDGNGKVSVQILSEEISKGICQLLDVNARDVLYDGWIDIYAKIDAENKTVDSLYVYVSVDTAYNNDRDMEITITNDREGKRLFNRIYETAGEYQILLDNLLSEAVKKSEREKADEFGEQLNAMWRFFNRKRESGDNRDIINRYCEELDWLENKMYTYCNDGDE